MYKCQMLDEYPTPLNYSIYTLINSSKSTVDNRENNSSLEKVSTTTNHINSLFEEGEFIPIAPFSFFLVLWCLRRFFHSCLIVCARPFHMYQLSFKFSFIHLAVVVRIMFCFCFKLPAFVLLLWRRGFSAFAILLCFSAWKC